MLAVLAALSLASAPVQNDPVLAAFEAVCMAGAGEAEPTDAAATRAGWTFMVGDGAEDGSALIDYYAQPGRPAELAISVGAGPDEKMVVTSCRMVAPADFEHLASAIEARLGFPATMSIGESKLVWTFARTGNRFTELTQITDPDSFAAAVREDRPVHAVVLEFTGAAGGFGRVLSYERTIAVSPPNARSSDTQR
jgi:hypothetical protein